MGKRVAVGTKRVAPNGYTYIQTETGQRLYHHVLAEGVLGRPIDPKLERVIFIDGDRTNLKRGNLRVVPKGSSNDSLAAKRAKLEAKIADLQAQLEELDAQEN